MNRPKITSKKDEAYYDQLVRMQGYPEDRICFLHSESIAKLDSVIFNKYYKGDITKGQAMKEIAKNNCLDFITELQWVNTLRILGYYRPKGEK